MPELFPFGQVGAEDRLVAGGKFGLTMAKSWLREAGAARLFDLKPVREADLALQRLRFAPRLFRAAGYSGLTRSVT